MTATEVTHHVHRGQVVGTSGIFKCRGCKEFVSIASAGMILVWASGTLGSLLLGAALVWFSATLMGGYGTAPVVVGSGLGLLGLALLAVALAVSNFFVRMMVTQRKSPVLPADS